MIRRNWTLIEADFAREYRIGPDELAALGLRRFTALLHGLSDQSRFRQAAARTPRRVSDPGEVAALMARA